MAKKKLSLTVKGLLDIDEGTITEFHKELGEITHRLDTLLLPFNGLDSVNISISFDSEVMPED